MTVDNIIFSCISVSLKIIVSLHTFTKMHRNMPFEKYVRGMFLESLPGNYYATLWVACCRVQYILNLYIEANWNEMYMTDRSVILLPRSDKITFHLEGLTKDEKTFCERQRERYVACLIYILHTTAKRCCMHFILFWITLQNFEWTEPNESRNVQTSIKESSASCACNFVIFGERHFCNIDIECIQVVYTLSYSIVLLLLAK